MNFALASMLPALLPAAIAWAEESAIDIARTGLPLNDFEMFLARRVGVLEPARVRIKYVDVVPVPEDPNLQAAIQLGGFFGPNTVGLTLGHSIYIRNGACSTRLISHELRHVHQYEQAGSIALYLPRYFQQIVDFGYEGAPYEVDARAHEIRA